MGREVDIDNGDVCRKYFNATPLSIHSAQENTFVQQEIMKRRVDSVWIGLWEPEKEEWIWNDGSILNYSNWHGVQQNRLNQRQCAYMMAKGRWNVADCDSVTKHYICKYLLPKGKSCFVNLPLLK